jgi:uncharacterized surface protein with fasciclin (FAS1) repeats
MIKRTILLVASVLALALGAAACGGDDGKETTGTTAPTDGKADAPVAAEENIVAVAQQTPDLSTLVKAVSAAGLVGTLEEPGPYTVFAPANEAFEALGGTLDTLLEPENEAELAEVLTYHVVPGELRSSELRDGQMLKTAQGGTLEVQIANGEVTVDGAKVAIPDVEASNGVVHVIDEVLTPPQT